MNSGNLGLTPAEQAEQRMAVEQNQAYWKTEAPLLAAALESVQPQRIAGEGTMAAGQAAGGARARGPGLFTPHPGDTGAGPGSGANMVGAGGMLANTAGNAAVGAVGARGNATLAGLGRFNAFSQNAANLAGRAASEVGTAARIQSGLYRQQVEGKQSDAAAMGNLASSAAGIAGGFL